MRLGIFTGDDSWGEDTRPHAGQEIVGRQLRRIKRHQETGCPCTHGTFDLGGASVATAEKISNKGAENGTS